MKWITVACLCLVTGFVFGRWTPTAELRRAQEELRELESGKSKRSSVTGGAISSATDFLHIDRTQNQRKGSNSSSSVARRSMEERIETAKQAWRVRSDLARNSFLENLDAGREEANQFDVLIGAMNLRLANTIGNWVDTFGEQEVVRFEQGARLIHELSGAVVLTYDEMDRTLREDWREDTDPKFMLYDFIDPSVADPFIDVEDKMRKLRR
jgi:hypothetical protein